MTDFSDKELAENIRLLAAKLNEASVSAGKRGISVNILVHEINNIDTQATCVIDVVISKAL